MNETILIVEDEFLEANSLEIILMKSGYDVCGIASSVEQARKIVLNKQPDIVLIDIFLKGPLTGIDLAIWLGQTSIPFIFLSANSDESTLEAAKNTKTYGFLVKPFRERDILVALEIAIFRHRHIREVRLRQENWLGNLLSNITQKDVGHDQQLLLLAKAFQSFIQFNHILIDTDLTSSDPQSIYGFQRIEYEDYRFLDLPALFEYGGVSEQDIIKYKASYLDDHSISYQVGQNFLKVCQDNRIYDQFKSVYNTRSLLIIPVIPEQGIRGAITFFSTADDTFTNEHVELIQPLVPLLAEILITLFKSDTSISRFPKKRQISNEAVTHLQPNFPGIIGKSPKLLHVLDQVHQVARFETSVLILGETGVGKEGLVEAIHRLSGRSHKPLIKINCAAIPNALVESELFGHEKGSYTDAGTRRIGKFEQAQGGTVFLDEIGELPLDVQSKLLRVLQEKEIERVGGRGTIKVDVRIIAATNRNLYKEVAEGTFRMDLYYRINVFPIILPPLRERKEDIPYLTDYFLQKNAAITGTQPKMVSPQALNNLISYSWPGNIRELQHVIERNMLINKGGTIYKIELPEELTNNEDQTLPQIPQNEELAIQSIEEVEKQHILMVLQKCNGRISGQGGAAEMLRIPPSTLNVKMKKLGITWQHTYN